MQIAPNMGKAIELKIKVIEAIEKKEQTISNVASTFGISVWTARRWLKKYREGGLERLMQSKTPWNVKSNEITEKVYLLKEKYPKITLSQARKALLNKGIQLSMGCIRNIWQRYGLAGYDKKRQKLDILPNIPLPKDVIFAIDKATKILEQNGKSVDSDRIKEAAEILNHLPYCGGAQVLNKIPYHYLGLRRRVEKILSESGKEPLHKFYKRARTLRLNLEKRSLLYSSLRVGMHEANALFWMGKPKQTLSLLSLLEKRLPKHGDQVMNFVSAFFKGMALSRLLRLKEANQYVAKCKQLMMKLPTPDFYIELGHLYSNIGMYLQAKHCYEKASQNVTGTTRDHCLLALAGCYALNGEYQKVMKTIKALRQKESPVYTFIPLVRAQALFGQGMVMEAAQVAKTAMEVAKKNEVLQYLHTATMVLSCVYYSVGEKERAKSLVRSVIPILKKNWMMQDLYIRRLYLSKNRISIPERYKDEPFIKLILLIKKANQNLRVRDYNQALRFALRRGLVGYLHRLSVFNSEIILKLIEKGKPTGLPTSILRLPIFKKNFAAFYIIFLGQLKIYRNEHLLKARVRPKDAAFLIHLSMNKDRRMLLEEIYRNFWPRSTTPSKNLAHLLVRIRRTLLIPSHLLKIQSGCLVWDIYLNSDYGYFDEVLVQAKALERAGEWGFAINEYLRAFMLFRGEPFKKNYDEWSLNMRHRILTQLETETINFTRGCLARKNKGEAKKVLEKASKIIPESEEIKKLVNGNWLNG